MRDVFCCCCHLCQILSCVFSVILFMCGFIQVFVTRVYVYPLDFVHLVFQMLAGIWSMLTGVLCLASSWRQNATEMNSLGRKVSVFFNILLQIIATSLLLLDEAGLPVSIKHYLPNFKMPRAEGIKLMQSKDLMYLTGSGSLSTFMGILVLMTNSRLFQRKRYPKEESVVVLSARWVFQDNEEVMLEEGNSKDCFTSDKSQIKEISQKLGEEPEKSINGLDIKETHFYNANECQCHKKNNQESVVSRSSNLLNKPTYVRGCIVDDISEEDSVDFVEAVAAKAIMPIKPDVQIVVAPRRSPIEVHNPTPPNTFGNRRVLATPLSSSSICSIPDSITGRIIRYGTHSSFGSSSTYYCANSQVISESSSGNSTHLSSSSNYQSFSIPPDGVQQSFPKEQDSASIPFSNSMSTGGNNQTLIISPSNLYEPNSSRSPAIVDNIPIPNSSRSPDHLHKSFTSFKYSIT